MISSYALAYPAIYSSYSRYTKHVTRAEKDMLQKCIKQNSKLKFVPIAVSMDRSNGMYYKFFCNAFKKNHQAPAGTYVIKIHKPFNSAPVLKSFNRISSLAKKKIWSTFTTEISWEDRKMFSSTMSQIIGVSYDIIAVSKSNEENVKYRFFCNSQVTAPGSSSRSSIVDISTFHEQSTPQLTIINILND